MTVLVDGYYSVFYYETEILKRFTLDFIEKVVLVTCEQLGMKLICVGLL